MSSAKLWWSLLVVCVGALCSRAEAGAGSGCYEWRGTPNSTVISAPTGAAYAVAVCADYEAVNPPFFDYTCVPDKSGPPTAAPGDANVTVAVSWVRTDTGGTGGFSSFGSRFELAECPGCGDEDSGKAYNIRLALGVTPSPETCIDNCKATRGGSSGVDVCLGGTCFWTYTKTGLDCSGEPPEEPEPPNENCLESGGLEYCQKSGQQCGFVNDELVCLKRTNGDGCRVLSGGSRICGPQAPTPPVPDSGTPGNPAPPDGEITHSDPSDPDAPPRTDRYYDEETVGNSSRDPGSSGDNPGDGDDGSGADGGGSSGGGGDGEGGGGMTDDGCTEGQECTGGLPTIGGEGDCEPGACLAAFMARLQGSPLVAAVSTAGASVPTGACPSASFTMYGQSLDFADGMCSTYDDISGLLTAIFLIVWAWVATRIVMSA